MLTATKYAGPPMDNDFEIDPYQQEKLDREREATKQYRSNYELQLTQSRRGVPRYILQLVPVAPKNAKWYHKLAQIGSGPLPVGIIVRCFQIPPPGANHWCELCPRPSPDQARYQAAYVWEQGSEEDDWSPIYAMKEVGWYDDLNTAFRAVAGYCVAKHGDEINISVAQGLHQPLVDLPDTLRLYRPGENQWVVVSFR
jgi:hypothetical protein